VSTFTIPASLDEAVGQLEGIERLLTAKRWERAAILATFVTLGEKGVGLSQSGNVKSDISLSPVEFAALGIAGLKSHNTVQEYVRRWLEDSGRPRPEPGEVIDLDGLPPWDKPEPGTKYPPGKGGAEQRIKDQTSTVTAALDDEQFLTKVVESMSDGQRLKVYRQIASQGAAEVVAAMTSRERDGMATELRRRQRADAEAVAEQMMQDELASGVDDREGAALRDSNRARLKLHQPLIEASYTLVQVDVAWREWHGLLSPADRATLPGILNEMQARLAALQLTITDDVVGEVLKHDEGR
jgi:hypothetical protein